MVKRKVGALDKVDADLPSLQYKIRRDPLSYREEFIKQYRTYESQRILFMRSPGSTVDFGVVSHKDVIDFISHVADCYPDVTASFPGELAEVLTLHHKELEPELREKVVGSLVLLRRKDHIDSSRLLDTLFPILISTPSKSLRTLLLQKVLADLRTSNSKTINHRLNRTVQNTLYNLLTSDPTSPKGIWAVKITRDLWKRQIWTDSKAVEIMKEASLADNEKVIAGGVRFFLGGDKEREEMEDESSNNEDVDMGKYRHQLSINKKTRKKARLLESAMATLKKKERKKRQPHPLNFSAFHLLHDPQGFVEKLFSKHLQSTRSNLNPEQKLSVLQLVSRLIGLHKLTVISLYSYFLKYLTPKQPSVTSFLASLAQATHSHVPPDVLEPLVQKIANEFVSEAAASETASAGLNAIREICVRQPLAMNNILLEDLVMYKGSKDKGVMMAAKGLLSLYRDVGAHMLRKKDRGKAAAMEMKNGKWKEKRFGEEEAGQIEGLELLEQWKEEERLRKSTDKRPLKGDKEQADIGAESEGDEDGWDVAEDTESNDSGGWIDVESNGDVNFNDDDDDGNGEPARKRPMVDLTPTQTDDKENKFKKTLDLEDQISTFATTRILTPADLSKLQELRLEASVNKLLPESQRKRAVQQQRQLNRHLDDPLTAAEIEGLASLSKKSSKSDKIAMAKDGKADRSEHKSTQSKRKEKKESQGKSTTNKDKARKKNFMMTLGKAKAKQKHSLVERGRVLKAHVERSKRGGKRGNKGQ